MLKVVVIETQRQHARIGVTQSLDVGIPTIGMEMVVAPNMDVVRKGTLIGFATNLGSGLGGILLGRTLNRNLATNSNYWSCWDTSNGVY
jgi:hypothetical protein